MTLDRLAFGTLLLLALCIGLGDIASVTSLDAVLLAGVRGLLPLGISLALLAALFERRLPAFPSRLALPAAAWLAVLVVSTALAPSNRLEALASLERPASGALLAWAVYDLCRTRARWHLLAKATAVSGLAIALAGLAEATGIPGVHDWLAALHDGAVPIGDVPRVASTLSHPNEAAMLLELSLPLLVAWAWTASWPWRVPLALAALSNLVAMVLTFSRAGVVAGMAGLAVMAGLCVVRGQRRQLLSLSAAALAVPAALVCAAMADQGLDRRLTAELSQESTLGALTSVATALPASVTAQRESVTAQPDSVTAQPASVTAQPASVTAQPASVTAQPNDVTAQPAGVTVPQPSRMEFWTAALDMFRDHPWLGVGPDNFRWRFASYSGVAADNLGVHAHDQYLEALANTGVLGLLTLGWLLLRLLRTALDGVSRATAGRDWPWRAAILASLSTWLLHALLDDFERFWPASVAFWLLAGLNLRLLPDRQPTPRRVSGGAHTTAQQPKRATAVAVSASAVSVTARSANMRSAGALSGAARWRAALSGAALWRAALSRAALSAGALLVMVGVGTACTQPGSSASAYPTINGISCDTSEKVAFHIHAHLAIFANGQPVTVPYGIGIGKPWQIQQSTEGPFVASGSCFYWLHTHTEDGVIHIESPVQRTFTLGDFFGIWGQPLSTSQVATSTGNVSAYVNGERSSGDPNGIALEAHALIQLNVGQDMPPQPFTFPPGL